MDFIEEYGHFVEKDYIISNDNEETSKYQEEYITEEDILEKREVDEKDELVTQKFHDEDCCSWHCNTRIPRDISVAQRLNFMKLVKIDQDLVICSHLELHRHHASLSNEYKSTLVEEEIKNDNATGTHRQRITYFYADLPICQIMNFFLHRLTIKRFKNLVKHFEENGLSTREHKFSVKVSTNKNAITPLEIQKIVDFFKNYANKVAIPLPGRLPQVRNFAKVLKLPSSDTKRFVYKKFAEAVKDDEEVQIVSQSSFSQIWSQYCPEIATMKPATDLCDTCRQNHLKLAKLSEMSTEEQTTILRDSMKHLNIAKCQRDYYNSWRAKAKNDNSSSLLVISFDFAQNVSYPSSPQQVGSSYFKANRKCNLFGINNEGNHVQMNFLVDKEDQTAKGANSVISMIDYYLNNNKTEHVVLFSDKCVEQSKNNAVLHYLLWRVMTQKIKTISLNFLLTGHTKFSPDRNFGILKSKFAKSVVDCIADLIEVVKASSPNNFNLAIPSIDPTSHVRNVIWSEWDVFLRQYFETVPSLTKYHHFTFHEDGRIIAKLFSNSPEVQVHKPTSLDVGNIVPLKNIVPVGFSAQRF